MSSERDLYPCEFAFGNSCDPDIDPTSRPVQRNLLYTATTCGKKLVVIIGSRKALAIAVKNNRTVKRFTHLMERLKGLWSGSGTFRGAIISVILAEVGQNAIDEPAYDEQCYPAHLILLTEWKPSSRGETPD
jgi:hypothetical protein